MKTRDANSVLADNPEPGEISSFGRDWGCSHSLDVYRPCKGYSATFPAVGNYLMAYMLSGKGRLEQVRGQRQHSAMFHADDLLIRPAFQEATWRGDPPAHLRLRLTSHCMERAWEELGSLPARAIELPPVFKARDPLFIKIVPLLTRELSSPPHPAQKLTIQATINLVIAHLIRSYCTFGAKLERSRMQLAPHLVRRVCDYVEDHLRGPITLQDLADVAQVSRFHLCRSFWESSGFTPMQFVERARLRRAQALIRENKYTFQTISRMVGYEDQSQFSRRFRALSNCSPTQFRRHIHLEDDSPCELL